MTFLDFFYVCLFHAKDEALEKFKTYKNRVEEAHLKDLEQSGEYYDLAHY